MQEKNQIFRYPYDNRNTEYETVAFHLSDWLYLVHTLYYIITEERRKDETNAWYRRINKKIMSRWSYI